MTDDDQDLLRRFRGGGHLVAFATRVARHAPLVLSACRRVLGDAHDAEDASQAVFLILARKAARIDATKTHAPWLHRVAIDVARDVRRSRLSRERRHLEAAAMMRYPVDDAFTEALDAALCTLPERERSAIVLFHLEGRPLAEVAQLLNRPVGTVGVWLHRGRERLGALLRRRGVALSASALLAGMVSLPAAEVPAGFVAATSKAAVAFAITGAPATHVATLALKGCHAMKLIALAKTAVLAASLSAVMGAAGLLAVAAESPPKANAPMGSPGNLPTPERPFGWRGDGSGLYPGAHPPVTWSRRVAGSAVTNATYQARKPKTEGAAADAQRLELGIVKDWLVLGPFPADMPEQDIEKPFIADEAGLRPDDADKVGTLAWKPLHASIDTQSTHYTNEGTCEDYNVDFVFLYGQLKQQVAYAHTYVYSPGGGTAQLAVRHFSAAAKIWLNGKPTTLDPKDPYGFHKASVTLDKGWNRLLVKLSCAESTRAEGQNAWISKWRFAAYLSPAMPATYETTNISWMAKLPGFSASAPVVVGDRIFATCGTSDLLCLSKKDGRLLWLTTCTPCDAAGPAEQAAAGYQDKVVPLANDLRKANDALLKELNAASPLTGLPQDQQGKLDGMIRQKHELEKKLHDALRSIDGRKYPQLYINEVAGTNGTPISDGKRIYVAVGGGSKGPGAYVISAYSLEGERIWSYHEALGAAEHGNHASPALLDGKLIYGVMDTLIAFDAASGTVAWRTKLPKDAPHYWDAMNESSCTYVPTRIMGTAVLVAAPGRIVRAADGQLLSKDNGESVFTGMSTPLVANGMLYADGGKELLAEQPAGWRGWQPEGVVEDRGEALAHGRELEVLHRLGARGEWPVLLPRHHGRPDCDRPRQPEAAVRAPARTLSARRSPDLRLHRQPDPGGEMALCLRQHRLRGDARAGPELQGGGQEHHREPGGQRMVGLQAGALLRLAGVR